MQPPPPMLSLGVTFYLELRCWTLAPSDRGAWTCDIDIQHRAANVVLKWYCTCWERRTDCGEDPRNRSFTACPHWVGVFVSFFMIPGQELLRLPLDMNVDSVVVPGPSDDTSAASAPPPASSRSTTHAAKQGGLSSLSYGLRLAWHHLRPFIPFFLIIGMVLALVYLMQAIIFGGPFKDPLFFVKFNERWPRPAPDQQDPPGPAKVPGNVPSPTWRKWLIEEHRNDETIWGIFL